MSTDQQSYPRLANHSMTEESARPGTCRSKVGCDAMDDPCTNRIVPLVVTGSSAHFSNRKSLTSPRLVQCSVATTRSATGAIAFTSFMIVYLSRDPVPSRSLKYFVELSLHPRRILFNLVVVDRHRLDVGEVGTAGRGSDVDPGGVAAVLGEEFLRRVAQHEFGEQLGCVRVGRALHDRRRRGNDQRAVAWIDGD